MIPTMIHEPRPYQIPNLPLSFELESKAVLKQAVRANAKLAELKGVAETIPNPGILIDTLGLQESKDSSEIEQVITTHDELFRFDASSSDFSLAAKEVQNYREALFFGFREVQKNGLIRTNLLVRISQIITGRTAGIRNAPGTSLKNGAGEVIYCPPQDSADIQRLMDNLEQFINDRATDLDPLVRMAVMHHQFESIHPFFDGNGRTGRILNILYLILAGSINLPILYLSRFITQHKTDYYHLLQKVRDGGVWEDWIIFILKGVEETAADTIQTISAIRELMREQKNILRTRAPKFYSHELLNTIFRHPYTRIDFVMQAENITRQAASRHLKKLTELGLVTLEKHKTTNYYLNTKLIEILTKGKI